MWWSWLLAVGGITGLWAAGSRKPWGWALGLGMQLLWAAYAISTEQYGFLATAVAYGIVYGRNYWRAKAVRDGEGGAMEVRHGD